MVCSLYHDRRCDISIPQVCMWGSDFGGYIRCAVEVMLMVEELSSESNREKLEP